MGAEDKGAAPAPAGKDAKAAPAAAAGAKKPAAGVPAAAPDVSEIPVKTEAEVRALGSGGGCRVVEAAGKGCGARTVSMDWGTWWE